MEEEIRNRIEEINKQIKALKEQLEEAEEDEMKYLLCIQLSYIGGKGDAFNEVLNFIQNEIISG